MFMIDNQIPSNVAKINHIRITFNDNPQFLSLNGNLTRLTVEEFSLQIFDIIPQIHRDSVIIDCSKLKTIDGDGLGTLSIITQDIIVNKRHLMLYNLDEQPKRLFNILGLNHLIGKEKRQLPR